jgi:hypothetical protein
MLSRDENQLSSDDDEDFFSLNGDDDQEHDPDIGFASNRNAIATEEEEPIRTWSEFISVCV